MGWNRSQPREIWEHWSYSKLRTLFNCPLQFWFEYVLKRKAPKPPILAVGAALHYLAYRFFRVRYQSKESFGGAWKYVWVGVVKKRFGTEGPRSTPVDIAWKNDKEPWYWLEHGREIVEKFFERNADRREQVAGKPALGDKCLNIEHIGSTSIPGLASKPIIDIVAVVNEYKPAKNFDSLLKEIGYSYYSSSTERHFYRKGNPIKCHLSIVFANRGGFWVRQILFRDYLRTHDDARNKYEDLKKQLLKQDPTGRDSYLSRKDKFVSKILKSAGWKEGQLYSEYMDN